MRILVVSDTHRKWSLLHQVLLCQPSADIVLHLGDGEDDLERVRYDFPGRMFRAVAGNCDYMTTLPQVDIVNVEGYKIFMTHGHMYSVKSDYYSVTAAARQQDANICLFGHTHVSFIDYYDGMHIMNPGSLGKSSDGIPSYGIIDITSAGIVTNIVRPNI